LTVKNKDSWGMICSGICLLHCLATPFVLMSSGIGALGVFMASQWAHQLMIMPVVVISLFSFPVAYKKHRHHMPGMLAIVAVTGLIIAVAYLNDGGFRVISGYDFNPIYGRNAEYNLASNSMLTLISSSILIFAHIWNWRLSQAYQRNNS
jgi:MerC mercury resistance protein.